MRSRCFFCKRKTAYEMRMSDWTSDVCSSDLLLLRPAAGARDAGDRDRDVGVAVRQRARGHRPSGGERYLAEGFEDFAAHFELGLLGVGRIGDKATREHVAASRNVGERGADRSEEHKSELQSLMRISYAVFCLKKKNMHTSTRHPTIQQHKLNRLN